jgi:hypothetical protein
MNIEKIREQPDKVNWSHVSGCLKFSEDFIREFQHKVSWFWISSNQKLSEDFIREFQDKVNWDCISFNQKLSEDFIREFQNKVNWYNISKFQKLSEDFIREFKYKVSWYNISKFQKLSEDFIREFQHNVNLDCISRHQKLSEEFREEFNLTIPETCWLYKSTEEKEKYIKENTDYEIVDGKVIAYKSCRSDGYSRFNFQYHYEEGKEYESHADYNEDNKDSFGLSAWSKEGALKYCNEKLFKVEIKMEDISCIVHSGSKIRATKIKILNN